MGVCFVGKRNFNQFLTQYIETKQGNFIDIDSGVIVGSHNGFPFYTLGQSANIGGMKEKYDIGGMKEK
jgi:tRNA-specific 2-thiouridylase